MHETPTKLDALDVYFANNYREYLKLDIELHEQERGYQKRLADAAGCRASYLSQVLHSHIHLTPDQAAALCEFWSFNDDRTEYFLTLVHWQRAGAKAHKTFLQKKLTSMRDRHKRVSSRITSELRETSRDDRLAYYSNWLMPALHVLTSIESYQNPDAIAQRLRLPKSKVHALLDDLQRMGFVSYEQNRYKSIVQNIHVEQESPLNTSNHFQWRHHAMSKIVEKNPADLHYSAVHALSVADAEVLRELALKFIQDSRTVVAPSKEEEAIVICFDMFAL